MRSLRASDPCWYNWSACAIECQASASQSGSIAQARNRLSERLSISLPSQEITPLLGYVHLHHSWLNSSVQGIKTSYAVWEVPNDPNPIWCHTLCYQDQITIHLLPNRRPRPLLRGSQGKLNYEASSALGFMIQSCPWWSRFTIISLVPVSSPRSGPTTLSINSWLWGPKPETPDSFQ